jgi:hypothetical protein
MKISTNLWSGWIFNKQFIIWLMRVSFTILISFFFSLQLLTAASVKGQKISDERVSVKLKDEGLLIAIKQIEAQSSFRFFYRKSEVKEITGLNMELGLRTIENTLNELLKGSKISFKQFENSIYLEKRNKQDGYTIRGRILDPEQRPAQLAIIKIVKVSDSRLSFTVLADTSGRFNMRLNEKGEYMLKVSSPQRDTLFHNFTISNLSEVNLPDLILPRSAIILKDVDIISKRPLLSRSIDKLTLNIEGSAYEKGEDALRLFRVIPGIVMNGRDILFRGSEGVTVFVDNRRVLLQGDQLLSYLRSIPSESIRSYELKAVPGAEIDAQNAGVVINIVLKSEYKYGMTGNFSTGYWYNDQENTKATTFLNYRAGKFNLQGGANYFWSPAFYQDEIIQKFKGNDVVSRQTESYLERFHNISYNTGVDYKVSSNQTIGLNYNMFTNPGSVSSTYSTDIGYYANELAKTADSTSQARKSTIFTYANHMANLFYRNKLDTLGSRLDVGYSYIYYGLKDPSALETQYLNTTGLKFRPSDSLFTKTIGKSNVHVANIDLEQYFTKSTVLNVGGKFTTSSTDYTMDFRNGLNEQASLDPLKSNRFLYNEYILAFYTSVTGTLKAIDYKIGLRVEQTNYNGESITTQQTIGRNLWNLFPSLFLNRKFGADHSVSLSYNRRIERPGFRQLNPFVTYTNLNSIQEGNANLQPYFSNNLQLEYLLKNKYTLTVGYQNTNDGIAGDISNRGETIVYRDENISDEANIFSSLYIPIKLTKWWEFNTNATVRYRTIDVKGSINIHRAKLTQNLWATSKFNLPGKYFVEVSGFFNSNGFYGIYDSYRSGKIDVAVKKSFFKNRLTSSLEFQDPFYLYKPKNVINTENFTRTVVRKQLDFVRSIGLFLTYNFSSGKKQNNKENVNSAGNEARSRL